MKRLAEALAATNHSLALDPNDVFALVQTGMVFYLLRRRFEMRALYTCAWLLNPIISRH
jgi:hypothetical protein